MKRRQMYPLDSINNQLNIGVPNDPNIPCRYARGLFTMQPQLGVEDWSLDFYNDIDSLRRFSSAQGEDNYSNATARFSCQENCKRDIKWFKNKERQICMANCARLKMKEGVGKAKAKATADKIKQEQILTDNKDLEQGLSTGAKVGIAVGVLAVIGVVGYLIIRKK